MCQEPNGKETLCDFADLYILGSGSLDELAKFELHLQDCARCQLRVESISQTLNALTSNARPRPAARERLLQRMRAGEPRDASVVFAAPGLLARRAEKIEWAAAGLPGVFAKTLFADETRGYHTSIVKLDPGAQYPAHRHGGIEEVFVLEGDLQFDFGAIVAGDYCRAEADTLHSRSHTENGCVLLVNASTADELFPA